MLERIRHMLRRVERTERAHLGDARGFRPPVHRFEPPPALAELVRRFWIPVWSLPPGQETVQRVLQYPVCQVVVGPEYAQMVGPTTGLATRRLRGTGWVVGAMLQPAAGAMLLGGPVTQVRNRAIPLDSARRLAAGELAGAIRAAMAPDPDHPDRQQRAAELLAEALAGLLPVDEEGRLVNAIVEYVETDPTVHRVGQLCGKFALSERSLQRLLARRVGLTPKWLIQRRRLHEAAGRLRAAGRGELARLARELGYADQAHFNRDFRAVTGLTPGEFMAEPDPPPAAAG